MSEHTHTRRRWARSGVLLLALLLGAGAGAFGQPSGLRIVGEQTTSISQYGITWTFSGPVESGQYVTGDYWVIGPVEIVNIDPPSVVTGGRVINGSMINPDPDDGSVQGFDSQPRNTGYRESLNVARPGGEELSDANPLVVQPGSSLMSAISHPTPGTRPQITDAAVLTVIDSRPPDDAFRPPFSGTDKRARYRYADLDTSLLRRLAPVPSTPSLAQITEEFRRPWPDFIPDWMQRDTQALNNMPVYGRNVASMVGIGALMLHLDYSVDAKRELLIGFIQRGIDYWGIVQDGGTENWIPNGGHGSGRKWPILFAGIMLGDTAMQNLGPGDGTGVAYFGEDAQTFIVDEDDISRFLRPTDGSNIQQYGEQHRGMPEWGIRHAQDPFRDNADWRAGYRSCCTAVAWSGFVLAARIMDAQDLWDHAPLFHYQDRYMLTAGGMEDEWDVNGEPSGENYRTWVPFTAEMWDRYRSRF